GKHLYGRTLTLLNRELPRLGVECRVVDVNDLAATAAVMQGAKLLIVETLSNPVLRVADVPALAELARKADALLLVDNTFAGPTVFRPLEHGADLVMESVTKIINGHSDVLLGFVGGRRGLNERTSLVLSAWGLSSPPFECWLAGRGVGTLALRAERANANAIRVAGHLGGRRGIAALHFPGLQDDPGHALATRLFGSQFGTIVTFTLAGGLEAASRFIQATRETIPFCPSLGDLSTTLSHPASTSHRGMSPEEQASLGVTGGTIRLSIGVESAESIIAALDAGLSAACGSGAAL
ncbi:MAG TPA: PLP-dependent transferase, partial [Pirellulales bacterium]